MALVMDRLRELADDIDTARNTLDDYTAQRDDLLCQLKAAGVPERALMRLTGLSRSRIAQITNNPKPTDALLRTAELVASLR